MAKRRTVDWSYLPIELWDLILPLVGTKERFTAAQVCRLWRDKCRQAWMWEKIDISRNRNHPELADILLAMCESAISRSGGRCREFAIRDFAAHGTTILKTLTATCTGVTVIRQVRCGWTFLPLLASFQNLPHLTELEVDGIPADKNLPRLLGRHCPNLRILKMNNCQLTGDLRYYLDSTAQEIATIASLEEFEIRGMQVSDIGVADLCKRCRNLRLIDVRGSILTDPAWFYHRSESLHTLLYGPL